MKKKIIINSIHAADVSSFEERTPKGKKYAILNAPQTDLAGNTIYQIRALRDIGIVARKGELGGWISSEANLSQEGECWITADSMVVESSVVRDNALVANTSYIAGNVIISDETVVSDCRIVGEVTLSGELFLSGMDFGGVAKLFGAGQVSDIDLNDFNEIRDCIEGEDCTNCPHNEVCSRITYLYSFIEELEMLGMGKRADNKDFIVNIDHKLVKDPNVLKDCEKYRDVIVAYPADKCVCIEAQNTLSLFVALSENAALAELVEAEMKRLGAEHGMNKVLTDFVWLCRNTAPEIKLRVKRK